MTQINLLREIKKIAKSQTDKVRTVNAKLSNLRQQNTVNNQHNNNIETIK